MGYRVFHFPNLPRTIPKKRLFRGNVQGSENKRAIFRQVCRTGRRRREMREAERENGVCRAAVILNRLNEEKMYVSRINERKNMEKIYRTMNRLKQAQKEIQGNQITEPVTHQEGTIFKSRHLGFKGIYASHISFDFLAVTSGDYYMFDIVSRKDCELHELEEDRRLKELNKNAEGPSTPSVGQVVTSANRTTLDSHL